MNYVDVWKKTKERPENKDVIRLFLSGIFYKTFETDAEFLSSKFGLKIVVN
ncbi:MAG: hypothetical protein LBU14_02625 [Candidatus Peribacteria bacterium]|jgi:DNA mismatch repair ATPase MutS|nr:hypothetical protein [Candidatus Peribacteria bacterium]